MNAVIMDGVEIGEECIVGALCFVPAETKIARRSLVVGNPGKVIREVSDEMIGWKTKGTELYQQLPQELFETLRPCEPLREVPNNRPVQMSSFKTWKEQGSRKA
jgi:carbonic anhydrase/acetyltransferase-like protein (isoleucine patch superfamily)